MGGGAHVEGLVENDLLGRLERSNERTGDVLDMRDRTPGRSIRLEIDKSGGDREGGQIVEDDVEAHTRRNAISGRRPEIDRAKSIACKGDDVALGPHLGIAVGCDRVQRARFINHVVARQAVIAAGRRKQEAPDARPPSRPWPSARLPCG